MHIDDIVDNTELETMTMSSHNSVSSFLDLEAQQNFYDSWPPPLLVKLTGYRLLNILLVVAFIVPKAVLAYQGNSVVPTSLEWSSVGVVGLAIWWLGLYESVDPPVLPWLFSRDYALDFIFAVTYIISISTAIFRRLACLTNKFVQDKSKYFVLGSGLCLLCWATWDALVFFNVVRTATPKDGIAGYGEPLAFCAALASWSFLACWKYGVPVSCGSNRLIRHGHGMNVQYY